MLSFSREAGGAAVLAPVVEKLRKKGADVFLLAKGKALEAFEKREMCPAAFGDFSDAAAEEVCWLRWGALPDMVLTSATSLPQLDMTEKRLWRWAEARSVPSAALVDQWQNYALRFSGPGPGERLAYLPSIVFVMDEVARRQACADGLPSGRLRVAGQPALEETVRLGRRVSRADARRALGVAPGEFAVVFAAESLKKHFPDLGYDEYSILEFLSSALRRLAPESRKPLRLVVKLHPQNDRAAFERFGADIAGPEVTALEAIRAADLLVGMTSVLLLQSILLKTPTLSLQLGSRIPSQLTATKTGALPFLNDGKTAYALLRRLILDPGARRAHAARQSSWGPEISNSVSAVIAELERTLNLVGAETR